MQKSTMLKKEQALANRQWYVIDATDLVLGKLSVFAADLLRGKNKPEFTPNVDCGDHLIIINADKIRLTGNKAKTEYWHNHSHYMGGLRSRRGDEMIEHYSDELITRSIKGMLPKNKLSRQIITKLHVYKDANHGHEAQQPQVITIK